jgi:hypothetical protein
MHRPDGFVRLRLAGGALHEDTSPLDQPGPPARANQRAPRRDRPSRHDAQRTRGTAAIRTRQRVRDLKARRPARLPRRSSRLLRRQALRSDRPGRATVHGVEFPAAIKRENEGLAMSDDTSSPRSEQSPPQDLQAVGEMTLLLNEFASVALNALSQPKTTLEQQIAQHLMEVIQHFAEIANTTSYLLDAIGQDDEDKLVDAATETVFEISKALVELTHRAEVLTFGRIEKDPRPATSDDAWDMNMAALIWSGYRWLCINAHLSGKNVDEQVAEIVATFDPEVAQVIEQLTKENWPAPKAVDFIFSLIAQMTSERIEQREYHSAQVIGIDRTSDG